LEDAPARAVHHLQMALYYNPHDAQAHEGLAHEEWEGFRGTPEDVAFVKRMRELERVAGELASKDDYDVQPVEGLPPELKAMVADDGDIEFYGAKSPTFTIYTRGTQQNAIDCV